MNRFVLGTCLALLVVISLAGIYTNQQLSRPVGLAGIFDIPAGDNLSSITTRLGKSSLLPVDEFIFKVLALSSRQKGQIKAGQYWIEEKMTAGDLLDLFRSGRVMQHPVTFPEGWTFAQWRQRLQETPYLLVKTEGQSSAEIAAQLGVTGDIEGRLFPDTYVYTKGDTDLDIMILALTRMDEVLNAEWSESVPNLASPYEALILASIIEKETGRAEDREKIASVFHNRLALNMKLQSDPTVIYGLGTAFDGDLKRSHLRTDSPYNTYMRKGLPLTPICSPGLAAIKAAMTGSAHPYIYFVARGDGSSQFSETLDEHNAAVRAFQLNQAFKRTEKP